MIRCGQKSAYTRAYTSIVCSLLAALMLSFFSFSVTHAEIGAVSSPAQPDTIAGNAASDAMQNDVNTDRYDPALYNELMAKNKSAVNSDGAIMIIRFNQKNVYFQNPLKMVVYRIAKEKPDARYELRSIIPEGSAKRSVNGKEYGENLGSVIAVLNKFGVSTDRISVDTVVSDSIKDQEINIFVR